MKYPSHPIPITLPPIIITAPVTIFGPLAGVRGAAGAAAGSLRGARGTAARRPATANAATAPAAARKPTTPVKPMFFYLRVGTDSF